LGQLLAEFGQLGVSVEERPQSGDGGPVDTNDLPPR
jgi:hypothetical protein